MEGMSEVDACAIAARVAAVRAQIFEAAERLGRDPATVTLVAVSKTQPAAVIRAAFAAGVRVFGENYVQEAVAKQEQLTDLPVEWHFIGPIQRNKTRAIAAAFDWVHSLDRLEVAKRFAEQRDPKRGPLNVMVQVNVSGEASKAGVAPEEVVALVKAVARLPRLQVVGLMTIPEPSADPPLLSRRFRTVRELRDTLQREGLPVWALSMGMSSDWPVALAEGATHLRIGSALFGPRPPKTSRREGGEDASGKGAKACG